MELRLPPQSRVDKVVPKNTFFKKAVLNTKLKDEFTDAIAKITWRYKISEDTVSIPKTSEVEEIQVFQIELKESKIPQNALKVIDRLIPYQILYVFTYEEDISYGITIKDDPGRKYYFSDWGEPVEFDFFGPNLKIVYEGIVKKFIKQPRSEMADFETIVETDRKTSQLKIEIEALKNKIRTEKQFNRRVEFNKRLAEKSAELERIQNSILNSH